MRLQHLSIIDWAIIAISFFNTIALIWLSLTVLLNAERRTWGTWAVGGGLALGGLFFAGHSAAVGRAPGSFGLEMALWWRAIWLPVIGAPYAWYLVMAWYTGVLKTAMHRMALALVSLLSAMALAWLVVANPLPGLREFVYQTPGAAVTFDKVPIVLLLYPVYSTLCIMLALLALRRPEASERFMGDLARERAHPWLVGASVVLMGVSLFVGIAAVWAVGGIVSGRIDLFAGQTLLLLRVIDLFISGLIAVVIVLLGQAIVSYEIFTGKTLPRRGLLRHWRNSLILAASYGTVMALSLIVPVDQIIRLLLATILMTAFYALVSWRSYADHEQSMERLRPFVASQRLYERLLRPALPPGVDAATPFSALCADVLGARVAYLFALGPLAPLVGAGLAYPDSVNGSQLPDAAITELAAKLRSPQQMCVALDPAQYGGTVWAVPLWSERGLIGLLLLGDKRDGGLYTQEEIEIARATSERLIDTQASAEMARRLMGMQRQQLAETQVIDQRTRRVLHDDVLPRLHTTMLKLSAVRTDTAEVVPQAVAQLADIHNQIAKLLHAMPAAIAPEVAQLGLIGALRRVVSSELGSAFDGVTWQIAPEAERLTHSIPALTAEVIFFAARESIRNAARYGRNGNSARALHLVVSVDCHNGLEITIEDDGVGFGATSVASEGSGQGLALHSTMMAVIGGTLTVESVPAAYTRVTLALPPGWQS